MPREKSHKPYYMLVAHIKSAGLTVTDVAKTLQISRRTFDNKVNGNSDFTIQESQSIKKLLNKTTDDIFLQ